MDELQIQKLLESLLALDAETEVVEFKVNNSQAEVIGQRISALSNAANLHGNKRAYLVYGVEDATHKVVGTKFNPSVEMVGNQPYKFWLAKRFSPDIDYHIHEIKYEELNVVIFEIPPAVDQPIKFDNEAYIRIGSATPKLSEFPEKESRIWSNINRNSFEKGVAKENLTVQEVLEYLDYAKYFSLTKQELPSQTSKFVEQMEQHGLVKKVIGEKYDITNLGAVLFANDLNNFPSVKRKSVRVIAYEGDSKAERKQEREGKFGYAVAFENMVGFISDQLPHNEEITKALRKETKMYPEVAIREFVANALIHQDLSISGAGPTIEIFSNRIEITNTGEPLIDVDRFIDHPPRSRNEDLASFMRQIGICEEGGTGVDRALINIALYQLPAPSFEKFQDFTKITLYSHKELKEMTTDDKIRACYQHCVLRYIENHRMTNATLRGRLGIGEKNYPAASAIIKASIAKGMIKESEKPKEYVPIWA
jgi:predicted HTH transcriptional regulator